MKIWTIFIAIGSLGALQAQGQFKTEKQNGQQIDVVFSQADAHWKEVSIQGETYIQFASDYKHLSLEAGSPELPTFGETVLLPDAGDVKWQLEILESTELKGVKVAPSKGNLNRNVDPATVAYTFGKVYDQNAWYPSDVLTPTKPFVLRHTRGQVVHITPFQYNPQTNTLRIIKKVRISAKINTSVPGVNEVKSQQAAKAQDLLTFKGLFLNEKLQQDKYNAIPEAGEMLVILPDSYTDALKPLLDWKTESGIKIHQATTLETGNTPESIKAYIENQWLNNPKLKYLLLVGDHEQLPTYSYGKSSSWEELYSDTWYAQLAGDDLYPELFVGRFSGNVSEVEMMVSRNLEYEKNPMSGNWMKKAIGLASSEGAGFGDEGQADWQHQRGIRDQLLAYGYDKVYEFYDGSRGEDDATGSPMSSAIRDAVSAGIGLFNYTGHGDLTTNITGGFSNTHINAATNNGMYPVVVSVACNNGTFVGGTCLAEAWQRSTENGTPAGAIAAFASSILMAWAPPMETQDEMTNLITAPESSAKFRTIGGLFYNAQLSMLENYPWNGEEVMQTWVMFGDPTVVYRNDETTQLTASTTSCFSGGAPASISVSCPEDHTVVAVTQSGKILAYGVSSGGVAELSLAEANNTDTLLVTATKQNAYPMQMKIALNDLNCSAKTDPGAQLLIYPNPAGSNETVSIEYRPDHLNARLRIFNETGQEVTDYVDQNQLLGKIIIELKSIRKGMYILEISDGEGVNRTKFAVY